MTEIIIAGIFTIIGALIAGLSAYLIAKRQRPEKFEEHIYKERLALHTELTKRIWKLYTAYLYSLDNRPELFKLDSKALELNDFICANMLLISTKALPYLNKLPFQFINIRSAESHKEVVTNLNLIYDVYLKIINILRSEFAVDKLTEEIIKMLKTENEEFKKSHKDSPPFFVH